MGDHRTETAAEGGQASNAWFEDSLFNLLVDYYPPIHFFPYGTGATRDNVLPVLRRLRLGYLSIYAKGHCGTTTYPSRLGSAHPQLGQDMLAFFREVTRETNTRLILYYSGMVDGLAGIRHPDWRMRDKPGAGKTNMESDPANTLYRMVNICPLSPYFEQWVAVQLEEMITGYSPDGIWVDGDWPGPCFCPRCEQRFRAETGCAQALPDLDAEARAAYEAFWMRVGSEWRIRFRTLIRRLDPACLYSAGNLGPRQAYADQFDWFSGDWFSPNNHRLQISASMRRYTTFAIPYDAFTCDTSFVHRDKWKRSRTKTLPRMLQEGATVLANGGQWGYWTYPTATGAFIPSRMRMAAACAEFAHARRHTFGRAQSARESAILDSDPHYRIFDMDKCNVLGAAKALIGAHHSPDIIEESDLRPDMDYEMVVLPEQAALTPAMLEPLAAYVERGGALLSSGESIRCAALQKLLGARLSQPACVDDGHVFLGSGDPAGIRAAWDRLELEGAEELYPLYLSWDYRHPEKGRLDANYPMAGVVDEENPEPAGFPAAILRRVGRGAALHVCAPLFQSYWFLGDPQMLAWFRELRAKLLPQPLFETDAPCFVEVSLRQRNDTLLVHFINGNPGRDLSYVWTTDYWVDEIPSIGPIRSSVRCAVRPSKAVWLPEDVPAETQWTDGTLTVLLPRLAIHSCLAIQGWRRSPGRLNGALNAP